MSCLKEKLTINDLIDLETSKLDATQQGYVDLLKHPYNRFFLTLSLAHALYHEHEYHGKLNFFWKILHERQYRKSFVQYGQVIEAIAVREEHKTLKGIFNKNIDGYYHFHIIIRDLRNDLGTLEEFREKVKIAVNKLYYETYQIIDGNKQLARAPLVIPEAWDLQEYYNEGDDQLEKYVTKTVNAFRSYDKNNDQVGISNLTGDGFEFGNLIADSKRRK